MTGLKGSPNYSRCPLDRQAEVGQKVKGLNVRRVAVRARTGLAREQKAETTGRSLPENRDEQRARRYVLQPPLDQ